MLVSTGRLIWETGVMRVLFSKESRIRQRRRSVLQMVWQHRMMIQGPDGRFYLYYFMGGTKMISVAVCDKPAGKYEFYGYVKYADGHSYWKERGAAAV